MPSLRTMVPRNEALLAPDPSSFMKHRARGVARPMRLSLVLSCFGGLALIASAWCLTRLADGLLFRRETIEALGLWLAALSGLYAARAALGFAAESFAFRAGAEARRSLRRDLMAGLFANGREQPDEERSGAVVNAYVEGVEALHEYYAAVLPSRVTAAFVPMAICVAAFASDPWSGLILFVTAPLIPVFMIWIGKTADSSSRRQWRRMAYMSGHFLDAIRGLPTIQLFNAARREKALIGRIAEDFRRDTMAVLRIAFLSSLALEFFATVSIAMIAVLIGFRLFWGEMSFAHGFFVLLLAPEFYLPLRRMGALYHAKMDALAAVETIMPLLSVPATAPAKAGVVAGKPVSVAFEGVVFAYPEREPVLRGLSFAAAPGERIALTGPSGAGKSTVLMLLLGFLTPQDGRVLADGIDLRDIDLAKWRHALSWLPQRPTLFTGDVRSNILRGDPMADAGFVDRLIRDCGVSDFAGARTGERGAMLSGGQAQRVAVARTLLRRSGLILLDEPTAHLDPETEALTHDALARHAGGATILFAAHRGASIRRADRVVHIGDGAAR